MRREPRRWTVGAWLDLWLADSDAAGEEFLEVGRPVARSVAAEFTRPVDEAEDWLMTAFLRAVERECEALRRARPETVLAAWIHGATLNASREEARAHRVVDPRAAAEREYQRRAAEGERRGEWLSSFTDLHRSVLTAAQTHVLRIWAEGISYAAIAERLGRSLEGAADRLSRARATLVAVAAGTWKRYVHSRLPAVPDETLARFSPRTQRAYRLWQAGRTRKEIAVELSMTVAAVHALVQRLRKRLRPAGPCSSTK